MASGIYLAFNSGNGEEEMVACSWDGTTFVVDQYQNVLKLRFEDRVQAFAAGEILCLTHIAFTLLIPLFSCRIFLSVPWSALPSAGLCHLQGRNLHI